MAEEMLDADELLEDQRCAEEFRQDVITDLKFAREQCSNLLKGTAGPEGELQPVKDHAERGRLIAIRVLLNDTLKALENI